MFWLFFHYIAWCTFPDSLVTSSNCFFFSKNTICSISNYTKLRKAAIRHIWEAGTSEHLAFLLENESLSKNVSVIKIVVFLSVIKIDKFIFFFLLGLKCVCRLTVTSTYCKFLFLIHDCTIATHDVCLSLTINFTPADFIKCDHINIWVSWFSHRVLE